MHLKDEVVSEIDLNAVLSSPLGRNLRIGPNNSSALFHLDKTDQNMIDAGDQTGFKQ